MTLNPSVKEQAMLLFVQVDFGVSKECFKVFLMVAFHISGSDYS